MRDLIRVDFLARYPEGGQELIQVCANLDTPATRERETRALLEGAEEQRDVTLSLIGLTPEIPRDISRDIVWHSATAWLLAEHRDKQQPKRRGKKRAKS